MALLSKRRALRSGLLGNKFDAQQQPGWGGNLTQMGGMPFANLNAMRYAAPGLLGQTPGPNDPYSYGQQGGEQMFYRWSPPAQAQNPLAALQGSMGPDWLKGYM